MSIDRLGDDAAVISMAGQEAALVTFSRYEDTNGKMEPISKAGSKGEYKLRFWGAKNNLPQFREQLVMQNNIIPALLKTKRNITFGTGLFANKKVFKSDGGAPNIEEVQMPADPKLFYKRTNIDDYLLDALKNYFVHANIFTEVIMDNDGMKVTRIRCLDCKYVRLGEMETDGRIKYAYISGNWAGRDYSKPGDDDITRLPLIRLGIDEVEYDKLPPHFIIMTGDTFFNDGYYNSPDWFSGRTWIEVSNAIPLFHQQNINNGYTFRFHIKIPKGYFYKAPLGDATDAIQLAQKDEIAARDAFLKSVNDMFSGVPGAGRAVWTQYDVNNMLGGKYPDIIIEPINYDMKDKSLLELFEKSNTANISGQGVHPVLANIETAGKLSSGSEIRNAFLLWLAINSPIPRKTVLKVIDFIKEVNKWDEEINYSFGDIVITSLDNSPTGVQEDASVIPNSSGTPSK